MRPLVYTYQDPIKQTTYFRGYTKRYHGHGVAVHTCPDVRTSWGEAERDAKKLISGLRLGITA